MKDIRVVTFEYVPAQPDEIALQVGDQIEFLSPFEEGWARGVNLRNNKVGLFPTNFVSDAVKPKFARVLFKYVAEHEDELSLPVVGAVVKVLNKNSGDAGWWFGELNGKCGLFPDNFVEPIEKPSQKPPAKPPVSTVITSQVTNQPPSVPAKPAKNILAATNINIGEDVVKNRQSTPSGVKTGGSVADLKNKLMSQGLFQKRIPTPGESSLLTKSMTSTAEPPVPSLDDIIADSIAHTSALIHVQKTRPKTPGRRPRSVIGGPARSNIEISKNELTPSPMEEPFTLPPKPLNTKKPIFEHTQTFEANLLNENTQWVPYSVFERVLERLQKLELRVAELELRGT